MSDDNQVVHLPMTLAYLAARMSPEHRQGDMQVLTRSILQRTPKGIGLILKEQAKGGMPEAILPFRRSDLDIAYAVAVAETRGQYRLRGLGHCVDAGYFEISIDSLEYVDEVTRSSGYRSELLPFEGTSELIKTLDKVSLKPVRLKVEELENRGFLSLSGGWVNEMLRINQPENRRTRPRDHISAEIRLLVAQGSDEPEVISKTKLGRFAFRFDTDRLVLKDIKPEQIMEMQAAWFKTQAMDDCRLWVVLENAHLRCLAPMPDVMEPGAESTAWLNPHIHIQQVLGGSESLMTLSTRREVRELMQRFNWMSVKDEADWIRLAQPLVPHALEIT